MSNDPGNQGFPAQAPIYGNGPALPPKKGISTLVIVLIVLAVLMVMMLPCCIGLLLPAVQQAREAARKMSCASNARMVGLALMEYEAAYKSLPPAYTMDSQGNRLHSWRTLILPFMGGNAIYGQIDLDKPWDDPVNARARQSVMELYRCPSDPANSVHTNFVVIDDPEAAFNGSISVGYDEITDAYSSTILIVEYTGEDSIEWMEPRDISLAEFLALAKTPNGLSNHYGGFHVSMSDVSIRFISSNGDVPSENDLRAMATKAGGEPGF